MPAQKATTIPNTTENVSLQTPLHMAIAYNHPDVVSVILEQKGKEVGGLLFLIAFDQLGDLITCCIIFSFTIFPCHGCNLVSGNPIQILWLLARQDSNGRV